MIKQAKDLKRGNVVYSVLDKESFVVLRVFLPFRVLSGGVPYESSVVVVSSQSCKKKNENWLAFDKDESIPVIGQSTEVF